MNDKAAATAKFRKQLGEQRNPNVLRAGLYCFEHANLEPTLWEGGEIPRGSFLSSLKQFGKDCGISKQSVRTAWASLAEAGLISSSSVTHSTGLQWPNATHYFTILSIANYESYFTDELTPAGAKANTSTLLGVVEANTSTPLGGETPNTSTLLRVGQPTLLRGESRHSTQCFEQVKQIFARDQAPPLPPHLANTSTLLRGENGFLDAANTSTPLGVKKANTSTPLRVSAANTSTPLGGENRTDFGEISPVDSANFSAGKEVKPSGFTRSIPSGKNVVVSGYNTNEESSREGQDFPEPNQPRRQAPLFDYSQIPENPETPETPPEKPPTKRTRPRSLASPLTENQVPWFAEFWEHYPLHIGKMLARRAFGRVVTSEGTWEAVKAGESLQLPFLLSKEPSFRPHASSWLNQRRWEDELPDEVWRAPRNGRVNGSGNGHNSVKTCRTCATPLDGSVSVIAGECGDCYMAAHPDAS